MSDVRVTRPVPAPTEVVCDYGNGLTLVVEKRGGSLAVVRNGGPAFYMDEEDAVAFFRAALEMAEALGASHG